MQNFGFLSLFPWNSNTYLTPRKTVVSALLKHWRFHSVALYLSPKDWWYHTVVISPFITTSNTEVLFALQHQYFRTGITTILMIHKTFCKTIKDNEHHGRVVSCTLAQKWVAWMVNHKVWRTTSGANTVAQRPFRVFSGNRAYGVVEAWMISLK